MSQDATPKRLPWLLLTAVTIVLVVIVGVVALMLLNGHKLREDFGAVQAQLKPGFAVADFTWPDGGTGYWYLEGPAGACHFAASYHKGRIRPASGQRAMDADPVPNRPLAKLRERLAGCDRLGVAIRGPYLPNTASVQAQLRDGKVERVDAPASRD